MHSAVRTIGETWQGIAPTDVDVLRRVAPGLSCVYRPDGSGRFFPHPEDVVHVSADSAFGAILHPGHADTLDALCQEAVTFGHGARCRLAIPRDTSMRSLELIAIPIWDESASAFQSVLCRGHDVQGAVLSAAAQHRFPDHDISRGIDEDEFVLHYQPIYEMRTGRMVSAEALLRWDHPEHGLVPPLDFIGQLEDTGAIVEVGHWVLQEACAQAMLWSKLTSRRLGVSVNVSAHQIESGTLLQSVRAALAGSGLAPSLLTVEVTETRMVGTAGLITTMLGHLRAIGVQVAIDDFGTGYSNLARLRQVRGRVVKIDRSLVSGVDSDPDLLEMLRAVVALAKSLDCVTVAEGVEEADELEQLRLLGLDYSQGFHHARPMPVEEFADFVVADLERPLH